MPTQANAACPTTQPLFIESDHRPRDTRDTARSVSTTRASSVVNWQRSLPAPAAAQRRRKLNALTGTDGRSKVFYGWFVVAACFLVTMTLGETFWSFGVFFKPLQYEFGWSRTLVSSGYTTFLLGFAVGVIGAGRLVDRYSPRPILAVAAVLAGLGVALCSQIQTIHHLRIFLCIAGLGGGATWSVPSSTVQRWFRHRDKSGLALGVVVSGVGVGALTFAPLINHWIYSYSWREAYLFVGIIYFVSVALSSIVIKRSPAEPAGAEPGMESGTGPSPIPWTTRTAVRSLSFVSIALAVCVGILAFQVICVHIVPHAIDVGISSTASAAALGLMGGFSVPGRLISGVLADRIGWQRTLAVALFGMAAALVSLLFLRTPWMLYCFVFLFGLCHGARVVAQVGIIGQFFGVVSLGELIGITTATGQLVGAAAPYAAGFIFDSTGSYSIAFVVLAALLAGTGFFAALIRKPAVVEA